MGVMELRRMLLMQAVKSGVLPDGYTQLSYIESISNHYIVTDVNITDMTDIIRATFAFPYAVYLQDYAIFGGRAGRWSLYIGSPTRTSPYTQKPVFVAIGANNFSPDVLINPNEFCEATVNPNNDTCTIDGIEYPVTNRWDRYPVVTDPYLLFASLNSNAVLTANSHVKLKYAEVVNKGIFIPCMRDSDGKVGVYNTITGTFLTNAGTGEFGYETLDGVYVAPTSS